jgi:hypothetical protein
MVMRAASVVEQSKDGRFSFYRVNTRLPGWARRMIDALRDGARGEEPFRRDRKHLTLIAQRNAA